MSQRRPGLSGVDLLVFGLWMSPPILVGALVMTMLVAGLAVYQRTRNLRDGTNLVFLWSQIASVVLGLVVVDLHSSKTGATPVLRRLGPSVLLSVCCPICSQT